MTFYCTATITDRAWSRSASAGWFGHWPADEGRYGGLVLYEDTLSGPCRAPFLPRHSRTMAETPF